MKPNDCVVLFKEENTIKCVLDGQEFNMTKEQFETLNTLYSIASNIFAIEQTELKCAYINENNEIKVLCK